MIWLALCFASLPRSAFLANLCLLKCGELPRTAVYVRRELVIIVLCLQCQILTASTSVAHAAASHYYVGPTFSPNGSLPQKQERAELGSLVQIGRKESEQNFNIEQLNFGPRYRGREAQQSHCPGAQIRESSPAKRVSKKIGLIRLWDNNPISAVFCCRLPLVSFF